MNLCNFIICSTYKASRISKKLKYRTLPDEKAILDFTTDPQTATILQENVIKYCKVIQRKNYLSII